MTPYPHQETEAADFGTMSKRAMLWSPRIGKTYGSILSAQKGIPDFRRGIVVSPFGVCGQWARFLEACGYTVVRLYDAPNTEALAALSAVRGAKQVVAVVNYDRLAQSTVTKAKEPTLGELLLYWEADVVILDESHYMVSPSAKWARAARKLGWQAPWLRTLTGTPVPNHLGNLWGQMSAIAPEHFGWAYKHFADKWVVHDNIYPSRVLGYKNLETLTPFLQHYCSIKRRDEVFGPDQWVIHERQVEMPAAAARMYARLAREWLIDDPDTRLLVDGSHILTRLIRLQQLASGYIVDDDTNEERSIHTAKLDAVMADLGEIIAAGEKAIVFHRFRWEGRELVDRLAGKVRLFTVNGDVGSADREACERAIREDEGPIVAVVQTKAGGIGVSYAESAYALMVSESFSFVQETQAHDRIFKPGVPRHLMFYRTQGTVDEFIAERQQIKGALHEELTHINRHDMAFGSKAHKHVRKIDMIPSLG